MATIKLNINNTEMSFDVDPQMPLLWLIRDFAGLTGTKYGCGVAQCGACTVHIEGKPVRSCSISASAAMNKKIITIEGLSSTGSHPVQMAWLEQDVPQCGYCQAGQMMTAAALLAKNPNPSDEEITNAMTGNLCRCGTYLDIHKAVRRASLISGKQPSANE
jgi:isoquinoline 1-oxidoreductase alpha subunit